MTERTYTLADMARARSFGYDEGYAAGQRAQATVVEINTTPSPYEQEEA